MPRLRNGSALRVNPAEARDVEAVRRALQGACAVLTAGAAEVRPLPEAVWVRHPTLRVLGNSQARF
ncbi:MAG: hypothetical protein U9R15_07720 [Chloroflexota bacterium]|nr:hypothetical protein [Chloroflexota bacterium]